jgi:DNA-directed RNA polymerase subunit M/transcription elongation factor TFIIS
MKNQIFCFPFFLVCNNSVLLFLGAMATSATLMLAIEGLSATRDRTKQVLRQVCKSEKLGNETELCIFQLLKDKHQDFYFVDHTYTALANLVIVFASSMKHKSLRELQTFVAETGQRLLLTDNPTRPQEQQHEEQVPEKKSKEEIFMEVLGQDKVENFGTHKCSKCGSHKVKTRQIKTAHEDDTTKCVCLGCGNKWTSR